MNKTKTTTSKTKTNKNKKTKTRKENQKKANTIFCIQKAENRKPKTEESR